MDLPPPGQLKGIYILYRANQYDPRKGFSPFGIGPAHEFPGGPDESNYCLERQIFFTNSFDLVTLVLGAIDNGEISINTELVQTEFFLRPEDRQPSNAFELAVRNLNSGELITSLQDYLVNIVRFVLFEDPNEDKIPGFLKNPYHFAIFYGILRLPSRSLLIPGLLCTAYVRDPSYTEE